MKKKPKVWHKVRAPQKWTPAIGEEVIGEYIGNAPREGTYGGYNVHFIKIAGGNLRYVSGTMANVLFSMVPIGTRVKLIYKGEEQTKNNRTMKRYELYTEEAIELRAVGG